MASINYKGLSICLFFLLASLSPSIASVVKKSPTLQSVLEQSKDSYKLKDLNSRSTKLNKILQKKGKLPVEQEFKITDIEVKGNVGLSTQVKSYLKIVDKGLTSIEEDPWTDAISKTKEQLSFFEQEKIKNPEDQQVESFYNLSIAFNKFSQAGNLMDSEEPDFVSAKNLYLQTEMFLNNAESAGKENSLGEEFLNYVGILRKYIDEELIYVNETISE